MGTLSLLHWQKVLASHHHHIPPKPLLVQVFLNKKICVVCDLIFVILDLGIWIIGLIFFNLGIWIIGFD